jgi:hypothetical protein
MIAKLPAQKFNRMARAAWELARSHHTREIFAAEYRKIIREMTRVGNRWKAREDSIASEATGEPKERVSYPPL